MEQQEVRGKVLNFNKKNPFFATINLLTENESRIRIIGRPPEDLQAGQNLQALGKWETHKEYGPQFQAHLIKAAKNETELAGIIQVIKAYDVRTRFGVLQISSRDGKNHVVQGDMPYPHVGSEVWVKGEVETHQYYGLQIKIENIVIIPRTRAAIYSTLRHYKLSEEDIDTLYKAFANDTLWIMQYRNEELMQLKLDIKKIQAIYQQWEYHAKREQIAQQLQNYNLQAFTDGILSKFGGDAVRIIEQDPYRLIEVDGIGFQTAEQVGIQVDCPRNHPARIWAAIYSALHQLARAGHTCSPHELLVRKTQSLCSENTELIEQHITQNIMGGKLCIQRQAGKQEGQSYKLIYLPFYYELEQRCSTLLKNIQKQDSSIPGVKQIHDWQEFLRILSLENAVSLTGQQTHAVVNALREKVSILTGGPGTGKTTTLRMVINGLRTSGARLSLAAPTGKAAKRLAESSQQEVKTLHRLLGWNEETQSFNYNSENKLETDALLIDEASMIDIEIFKAVLEALPTKAHLVLVGDIYQLPSVGPGNVLRDLIESQRIPITELNQVFRQASSSRIVVNAYHINKGESLEILTRDTDFYLFKVGEKEIGNMICEIITQRLERVYGAFDPMRDIQVLAPMKKGESGIQNLNQLLQEALNPNSGKSIKRNKQEFRLNDKIIAIKNNYDKEVYNGDQGFVRDIDRKQERLTVVFDEKRIDYSFTEAFEELILAYCISTHRSQGSEYPIVIIPVSSEHGIMLQRNLLYTAVTRGRKMVILVGSETAIQTSIQTTTNTERHTGLKTQLQQ